MHLLAVRAPEALARGHEHLAQVSNGLRCDRSLAHLGAGSGFDVSTFSSPLEQMRSASGTVRV